jgi:hypothetical protein
LSIFGGANPKLGISYFEAYTMLIEKRQWLNVNIEKNIFEQKGTRPVIGLTEAGTIQAYSFSGQQPFEKMNSGVKICTTDLHKITLDSTYNQATMQR